MRWREQLEKDKQKWKELPDRQSKLHFLYDYYKVPILAAVLAVAFLGYIAVKSLFVTPVKLYAVLVNNDCLVMDCDAAVFDEIYDKTGYEGKGVIDVRTDLLLQDDESGTQNSGSREVLAALFTLGDLDVYACDIEHFDDYALQDAFVDLSLLSDEEILSAKNLYQIEKEDGTLITPGILVREGSLLHKAGYYHHDVILAVAVNAGHMEEGIAFIKEFLEK